MYDFLVSAQELNQCLSSPDLVLVDVRYNLFDPLLGFNEYCQQHIPGAVYADLDEDLAGVIEDRNGRHPLPSMEKFVAFVRRAGIRENSQVVAYDDIFGGNACRLWWMLQEVGHRKTAVLDGGLTAWFRSGFPFEEGEIKREPSTYQPRAEFRNWVELTPQNYAGFEIVDARSPERHAGKTEPIDPVAGRIPGSKNIFWKDNLNGDGEFLPRATLREMYSRFENPVFYCGSGVSACHDLFCYRYAGLEGERLFPGSWSKWCNNYIDIVERDG
jgi:thiosulfate/3-mercaptopyruvate sulfurtransferase